MVRRHFLDLAFDQLGIDDVLSWIASRDAAAPLAYIITPNVDHMIRFERASGDLRHAYESADLCLCDSRVLAKLARACGVTLTVAPGSDLTAALFARWRPEDGAICLIGGTPDHANRLMARYPAVSLVQHIPPMGLLNDPAARSAAITAAAHIGARLTLLAVGSPQQELLAFEMRRDGRVRGTALCIGASVDFLIGAEARAPRLIQRANLEWAWRLLRSPRRLARRYLMEGPSIFPMVLRWRRRQRASGDV